VKPWLLVAIALVMAAGAFFALLTSVEEGTSPTGMQGTPVSAPSDRIGDESRDALREILRKADEEADH
jgi:hypothetical protein